MVTTIDVEQWRVLLQKHVTLNGTAMKAMRNEPLVCTGKLTRPNVHDLFDYQYVFPTGSKRAPTRTNTPF
jgi:hypothetical protein